LSNRDLKIMELEALLAEAGSQAFQMNLPPELSLASPTIPEAMLGQSTRPAFDEKTDASAAVDPLRQTQMQAEQAYKEKNFALAEVLFQRVVSASPRNAMALSNLSAVQLELGKYTAAESIIRRALAISPDDAFSLTSLGIIQIKTKQIDQAIETLLHAISLDSADPSSFNYLGVAFGEKGNRARAIQEIEKAVNLSPDYLESHFNLAVLYSQGGIEEKALAKKHYARALELGSPPDPDLDRTLR